MLSTLGKKFSRRHFEIFFLFFQKIGFGISYKLSPLETVCLKCQSLFTWKNKKNVINLLSADFAQGVVKPRVKVKVELLKSFLIFAFNKVMNCLGLKVTGLNL